MIEIQKVASVYSGINGRCCCGCAGKHTYASANRPWSSKNRGYRVRDEEVSDRTVKLIVNKMNRLIAGGVVPQVPYPKEFVSVVNGNRLYIAYFVH